MKKNVIIPVLLIFLSVPKFVLAWGREGHHLVVEIAYAHLSDAAKQKLTYYLGGISLDDASTWMDDQRKNPDYKYLEHTHYINIEKGQNFNPAEKDNIFSELTAVMGEMQNDVTLTDDHIKLDLLILIHLTGDLHQPLHDGYGVDKGGNTINVMMHQQSSNLHSVWDTKIIEDKHITLDQVNAFGAHYTAEQIAAIKKVNIERWMMESRADLDEVYAYHDGQVDENYEARSVPIIEEQLYKAGIRLSVLLEKYLDARKGGTISPVTAPKQTNASYTAAEAASHIGETTTICDKVYGTKYLESSGTQPTFLNLGAAYPNSPFTVVIFGKDRPNFKEQPEVYYNNKKVCVTGLVKEYNGKPEIVITGEGEIKVVKE